MNTFNKNFLTGKVVLITGGATGIGLGLAKALGTHGAKVAIMGRRQAALDAARAELTAAGIPTLTLPGDVRDPLQAVAVVQQVVSKFGSLDILVNNAAGNFMCGAEELSPNGFKVVQEIDLQGTFNMCKAALPHLKRNREGQSGRGGVTTVIINITATLQYKATPFQVHAAAAKAGVDVVTQTLGVEWGQYGIRVVGIAPGPISGTEGGPSGRVFGSASSFMGGSVWEYGPLGRFGEIEDIAMATLFLVSDAASYITATTLVVDGGQWHGTSGFFHKLQGIVKKKQEIEQQSRKSKL